MEDSTIVDKSVCSFTQLSTTLGIQQRHPGNSTNIVGFCSVNKKSPRLLFNLSIQSSSIICLYGIFPSSVSHSFRAAVCFYVFPEHKHFMEGQFQDDNLMYIWRRDSGVSIIGF